MLVDPICFFISLYAAFCYAIIYLYVAILCQVLGIGHLLTYTRAVPAFPVEFQEVSFAPFKIHDLVLRLNRSAAGTKS